jgi:hypothetical protein
MKKALFLCILFSISLKAQAYRPTYRYFSDILLGRTTSAASEALGKSFFNFEANAFSFKTNPAMVSDDRSAEAGYSYSLPYLFDNYFNGSYYNYIGVQASLGSIGGFGFGRYYLKQYEGIVTTIDNPDGTGETFTIDSYVYTLAYSREVMDGLFAGVSANYMQQNIWNDNFENASLGFGVVKIVNIKEGAGFSHSLGVSLSIENLIEIYQHNNYKPTMLFIDESEAGTGLSDYEFPDVVLPQRLNAGVSYNGRVDIFSAKMQIEYRDVINSGYFTEISQSLELGVYDAVFLRGGNYSYNAFTEDFDSKFTYGFGVKLGKSILGEKTPLALSFDYARLKFEDYLYPYRRDEYKDKKYDIYSASLKYSF